VICDVCHGQHLIIREGRAQPCPECGGFGEVHCCDGLQEQPQNYGDNRRQPRSGRPESEPPHV
jgi:hypothetical protein